MRARSLGPLVALLAGFAACSRTESGAVVIKRPTRVDVQTTQDTLQLPSIRTKTETVKTPAVVGTQKETVIVNKPIIGTKKQAVKVPTIDKP
jgi:hypothetical protein